MRLARRHESDAGAGGAAWRLRRRRGLGGAPPATAADPSGGGRQFSVPAKSHARACSIRCTATAVRRPSTGGRLRCDGRRCGGHCASRQPPTAGSRWAHGYEGHRVPACDRRVHERPALFTSSGSTNTVVSEQGLRDGTSAPTAEALHGCGERRRRRHGVALLWLIANGVANGSRPGKISKYRKGKFKDLGTRNSRRKAAEASCSWNRRDQGRDNC